MISYQIWNFMKREYKILSKFCWVLRSLSSKEPNDTISFLGIIFTVSMDIRNFLCLFLLQKISVKLCKDSNGLGFSIAGGKGSTPFKGTDQVSSISFLASYTSEILPWPSVEWSCVHIRISNNWMHYLAVTGNVQHWNLVTYVQFNHPVFIRLTWKSHYNRFSHFWENNKKLFNVFLLCFTKSCCLATFFKIRHRFLFPLRWKKALHTK